MSFDDAISRVLEADAAWLSATPAPVPLGVGTLAPLVAGTVLALDEADWWIPGLRERAGRVLRGAAVAKRTEGLSGARPYRVGPTTPAPALRALHAVGLALAVPEVAVVVHLGAGSLADGACAEAFNLAALTGARVIFVVAWLDLGNAPVPAQSAATPVALAAAYGIRAQAVDGSSAQAVHDAVAAARTQPGPSLVQADLPAPRS